MKLEIIPAYHRLDDIRALFRQYADSLGFNLDYQNFEEELAELPGKYAMPKGRLYLAVCSGDAAGCVALRPLDQSRCEMKRLFVRPEYRGHGLGLRLIEAVIQSAKETGYRELLLDTIPHMKEAIGIYKKLGFETIDAYYDSPIPGTCYMRLPLHPAQEGEPPQ